MGFLKNFTRKVEEATRNIQAKNTSKETNITSDVYDAYYDFEDRYSNTCDKKEEKIYNVETNSRDPDRNVKGFKKMLELCHELEDFCASKGPGGIAYFKENYAHIYQEIQNDLDDYMKNEYEEDKKYFEEEKAKKKAIKSLSNKILKEIEKAGGSAMQKDLRKLVSNDEPDYFNQAIKSLLESDKISKFKEGSHVVYKTK